MNEKSKMISSQDIIALYQIVYLVKKFSEKNPIISSRQNFTHMSKKIEALKSLDGKNQEKCEKLFFRILKKLEMIIKKDVHTPVYYITGGHGGIIIHDNGYCEFDDPLYATDKLLEKMKMAIENEYPFNIEVAICCLEWIYNNEPERFSQFIDYYKEGKFEIINPTYSQPYNIIIGAESNIKQFEYGLNALEKMGLEIDIYCCTESSLHPQIPQILKEFGINHTSLRTRLLGSCPSSHSAHIAWLGRDNTPISALSEQNGIFNGEYFHGAFFQEIPNLLFQTVAKPFKSYCLYSSIEDFIMPQPYQEAIYRISKFSTFLGTPLLCKEVFHEIERDGSYKYKRDDFVIGDNLSIPQELHLNNKRSESMIISCEILHALMSNQKEEDIDAFFSTLWRDLLLTQTHDAYAVPFVKPGDYSQFQLSEQEYENLNIMGNNLSVSDYCIQIHKKIQEKCREFIQKTLFTYVFEHVERVDAKKEKAKTLIIFNPTPYHRTEEVVINQSLDNGGMNLITDIPAFGIQALSLGNNDYTPKKKEFENSLYSVTISEDQKSIKIFYEKILKYKMQFNSDNTYQLKIEKDLSFRNHKMINIVGYQNKKESFRLELTLFRFPNIIDFTLHSNNVSEIIINPVMEIEKSFINYPFGIEETTRNKIQSLDFLWMKGKEEGILYMQKNAQKFRIERETFTLRNLIFTNGDYQFSIAILKENSIQRVLELSKNYQFPLLITLMEGDINLKKEENKFLLNMPESFVNLWQRKSGLYLRLFNPAEHERTVHIKGRKCSSKMKKIDLRYNALEKIEKNQIKMTPWEIITLKLD